MTEYSFRFLDSAQMFFQFKSKSICMIKVNY